MVHGHGVINLMWMLVGIWMGLLLARALPVDPASDPRCGVGAAAQHDGPEAWIGNSPV